MNNIKIEENKSLPIAGGTDQKINQAPTQESEFDIEKMIDSHIERLIDFRDGYSVNKTAFLTPEAYLIKSKIQRTQDQNPSLKPEDFLSNHELKIYRATEKNKLRRSWFNVVPYLQIVFYELKKNFLIKDAHDLEKEVEDLRHEISKHQKKYWYLQDIFHQFGINGKKIQIKLPFFYRGKIIEGYKVLKSVHFDKAEEYLEYLKKQMKQDVLDNIYFTDEKGQVLDFVPKKDRHTYEDYMKERLALIKKIDRLIDSTLVILKVIKNDFHKSKMNKLETLKKKLIS